MIIASLTSWPPRIHCVARAVKSLLAQTIRPDAIELNLAVPEFPNREQDIPKELRDLHDKGLVNVNWLPQNENVFKKTTPAFRKYMGMDFVLFSCDDDTEYAPTYIRRMLEELDEHDAFCPYECAVGFITAIRSRVITPLFWRAVTPELVANGIGDAYVNHYLRHVKADCVFKDVQDIKGLVNQFGAYTSPNSERVGGYTKERVKRAQDLSRAIFENQRRK